jgi:hypothetical protein
MNKFPSPLFRSLLLIVLTFALLAGSVRAAYAGNGALTWKNLAETYEVYGTCSDPDGLYQITVVSSGAIHYVENRNGFKFSWAENGTYYLEPLDAGSSVTYSGRYTITLQDHLNKNTSVFKHTHTNVGLGSDGTREVFHLTTHLVMTPDGLVREVENVQWICN